MGIKDYLFFGLITIGVVVVFWLLFGDYISGAWNNRIKNRLRTLEDHADKAPRSWEVDSLQNQVHDMEKKHNILEAKLEVALELLNIEETTHAKRGLKKGKKEIEY